MVPALALLAGAGLAALRRTSVGLAVFVVLAALSVNAHLAIREPDARPDDLRTLAAALSAEQRPGDAVLYAPVNYRLFVAVYGEPYRKLVEPGPQSTRVWLVSRRLRGTKWENDPRLKELRREFRRGTDPDIRVGPPHPLHQVADILNRLRSSPAAGARGLHTEGIR